MYVKKDILDIRNSETCINLCLYKDILTRIGIPLDIQGGRYLLEAINIASKINDFESITYRHIYFKIAKKYDVTPISVESGIRRIIVKAWNNGFNKFDEILGYNGETVPRFSNLLSLFIKKSEFIA